MKQNKINETKHLSMWFAHTVACLPWASMSPTQSKVFVSKCILGLLRSIHSEKAPWETIVYGMPLSIALKFHATHNTTTHHQSNTTTQHNTNEIKQHNTKCTIMIKRVYINYLVPNLPVIYGSILSASRESKSTPYWAGMTRFTLQALHAA